MILKHAFQSLNQLTYDVSQDLGFPTGARGARGGRGHIDTFAAGEHEIGWSVDDYQNGLYICPLQARSMVGRRAEVMVKMAVSR